jgi:uncharacterized protein YigA (DUF484 family)
VSNTVNPAAGSAPGAAGASAGVQGITENDIAQYLANNPGFFERHAELLASVQLTSPHGQRAVSLQERQMEMLRERNKGLEHKIMDMVRNSQDNVALFDRLHRYTRSALVALVALDATDIAAHLLRSLQHEFLIPQVALRLWGLTGVHADAPYAQPVTADVKSFTGSLALPYCGLNAGFEAGAWLDQPETIQSLAMIPLHHGDHSFGLLVLGSPDATRYTATMGTEFLVRVGEITSAALARLYRPAAVGGGGTDADADADADAAAAAATQPDAD